MADINGNCSLKDVKNNFIFRRIFDNLDINKLLNIIRYNKYFQKRLNKDLDDYKNEYSIIVFEIIPVEDKYVYFLKKKEPSFHIYLNDNKEELDRIYITRYDNVKKIKILVDKEIKSFAELFQGCLYIKKIKFVRFNRKDINDMSYMFSGCSSLEELDISKMKTENVENMERMFSECSSLKEINLSKFKTNKVTNMKYMFNRCLSLEKLDLSSFDTNKVTNMEYMFFQTVLQ